MESHNLPFHQSIQYHWCGKFISPSKDWIHLTRNLWDYELIFVTEGILYIADGETRYTVSPGEYLLMAPTSDQHGFQQSSCQFYWMHFSVSDDLLPIFSKPQPVAYPILQEQDVPSTLPLPVTGTLASPDRLTILFKQLQDSDRRYRERSLCNSLCSAVLCEIYAQSPLCHAYEKDQEREQLCSDIQTFVRWHCTENLKVSDIASYFGYNEKYLTTLFKSLSGISLKQFMITEKMERAKAALSETNTSISNIAYSLGFQDPHHFTNAFRKSTGLSPSVYRESYSKRNIFQV